jgi:hypothetical protein
LFSQRAIAEQVPGVQFVVARAPNLDDGLFEPFGISRIPIRIANTETDDVLNACDAVVTASGTATVQTALYAKPMVVLYKLSPMTYRLGIRLARVDMYAMVNLIAAAHRGRVDPGRVPLSRARGGAVAERNNPRAHDYGARDVRRQRGPAPVIAQPTRSSRSRSEPRRQDPSMRCFVSTLVICCFLAIPALPLPFPLSFGNW